MLDARLRPSFRLLHLVYGLVPIVAGLDKFANILADWEAYLAPWVAEMLPFSPGTFMALVGVIEIAAGILVLVKPRIGAWVVAIWLVAIAINLILAGRYDVAVRDLVMACGAWVLARLAEANEFAAAREKTPVGAERAGARA